MDKQTAWEAFEREQKMRQEEYEHAIERAQGLLDQYRNRAPSTHLGHNLANAATALSEAAAKHEAALAAKFFIGEQKA